jgi:hypothetical protein
VLPRFPAKSFQAKFSSACSWPSAGITYSGGIDLGTGVLSAIVVSVTSERHRPRGAKEKPTKLKRHDRDPSGKVPTAHVQGQIVTLLLHKEL